MNERTFLAIKLITSHILLIIFMIIISLLSDNYTFFILSITQTVLLILCFAGYWEFFGLRSRRYFCGLIELIILSIFVWKLSLGTKTDMHFVKVFILSLTQFYLLFELIKIIKVIYERNEGAVEIEFPFKQGIYLVTDGGNSRISRLMNYHYYSALHKRNRTNNSMLYATDIVKIAGNKSNFLPKKNEEYPIFNESIYSPINGVVIKVVNDIPDNQPFSGNYPYNTGNTVVIKKGNIYYLLGHLNRYSIVVNVGETVKSGELIGAAGNSGWTERPHLHMQLIKSDSDNYWKGEGVCIRFRNKNLYKNRQIVV